jgi:hypothetical protein
MKVNNRSPWNQSQFTGMASGVGILLYIIQDVGFGFRILKLIKRILFANINLSGPIFIGVFNSNLLLFDQGYF